MPDSTAARITPRAVPWPAVARAPALQWVSTVPSAGRRRAPRAAHDAAGVHVFAVDGAGELGHGAGAGPAGERGVGGGEGERTGDGPSPG